MGKIFIIAISVIALCFLIGAITFPYMPKKMPKHWNIKGEADNFSSRTFGVFFMPAITLALFLILWYIPYIDPLKKNIMKFRNYYNYFILILIIFMLFIYISTLIPNFNSKFSITSASILGTAILFFAIAVLLKHTKRNWFIGIRTPWTMSNDRVWEKTNKLGGNLFGVIAIIILITLFLPAILFIVSTILILGVVIFLVGYSYWLFKRP
jgi:uncharacterized membrane protein